MKVRYKGRGSYLIRNLKMVGGQDYDVTDSVILELLSSEPLVEIDWPVDESVVSISESDDVVDVDGDEDDVDEALSPFLNADGSVETSDILVETAEEVIADEVNEFGRYDCPGCDRVGERGFVRRGALIKHMAQCVGLQKASESEEAPSGAMTTANFGGEGQAPLSVA